MPYIIRDTGSAQVATCEHLEDAIRVVKAELVKEEHHGRVIDRDLEGRWAIYDGFVVKMLWIETDNGSVVSFARQKMRPGSTASQPKNANLPTRTMQPGPHVDAPGLLTV
jgi:hypothetical protein